MGAYKDHKAEAERIAFQNMGVDYALLEAGVEVVKSAKTPEGSVDAKKLEEMQKEPEKYAGAFTRVMNKYVQGLLKIKDKDWNRRSEKDKSLSLKGFGITNSIITHLIRHIIPSGRLMNFEEVLKGDEHLESYRTARHEEFGSAREMLEKGYRNDRLGTVNEALAELKLADIIDPRAVGLKDFALLDEFSRQPADKLEEKIRKTEPRLLKSLNK